MPLCQSKLARVHIRWMIRRDMPEVLDIEWRSCECAWTEEDFLRCLRQRNCIGMVAEDWPGGNKLLGFYIFELKAHSIKILNFAVHTNFRRVGIGSSMLKKLKEKLASYRRRRITIEVRETNLGAQLFFSRQGFKAIQVLRRFYDDTDEDAFWMHYCHKGE